VIKHEIGHALRLDHPGDNGFYPQYTTRDTIMSYSWKQFSSFDYRPLDRRALRETYTLAPDAIDKALQNAPPVATFTDTNDIAVTATEAAGHSVSNAGAGRVVLKMTEEQSKSKYAEEVVLPNGEKYYAVVFKEPDGKEKVIHVDADAQIAVRDARNTTQDVAALADTQETWFVKTVKALDKDPKNAAARNDFFKKTQSIIEGAEKSDGSWDVDTIQAAVKDHKKKGTDNHKEGFLQKVSKLWKHQRETVAEELGEAWKSNDEKRIAKAVDDAKMAYDINSNGMSYNELAALGNHITISGEDRTNLARHVREVWDLPREAAAASKAPMPTNGQSVSQDVDKMR